MAARVCVGGAGAGAEPTPPTLTHSAPQPGRSARCLFFCSAPTTPGSPPPRLLASLPPSPPPRSCGDPHPPPRVPLPKPGARCLPGPPAGCRGYNGAAEKRDLTFHGGRGGETPPPPARGPPPLALLLAFRERGGQWGSGWWLPCRSRRAFISPSRPSPAPPPLIPPGGAGKKRGLRQAGKGWMRKEATGSPPPHRP